jgi:hypothetical protein
MPTRIDHVIIAGPDLGALEETFTNLGFYVTGGGDHPHLGTRNRIVILDESYIELLAVADAERASPALVDFIAKGGGWIGYALQSADIVAETEAMLIRAIDARGPNMGRLVAPDGVERGWRVTSIGSDDIWQAAFPLPFLIQHDSTGSIHRRELAGAGGIMSHRNAASHLMSVRVTAPDIADLARRYETVYRIAGSVTRSFWEGEENVNANFPLESGEAIQLNQARVNSMSVRIRVNRPEVIEELRWPTSVSLSRTSRTLIVALPNLRADIEFTASR